MIEYLVLLLNCNYEPLNVCHARRALVLLDKGKAELLVNGRGHVRSATQIFDLPSVIRLIYQVRRPLPRRRLTRREAFARDRFRCQYCGRAIRDLTLDHVLPRVRGGRHVWENIVSACKQCNHYKGNRTPAEAGMRLLTEPKAPALNLYSPFIPYLDTHREWRPFVPDSDA